MAKIFLCKPQPRPENNFKNSLSFYSKKLSWGRVWYKIHHWENSCSWVIGGKYLNQSECRILSSNISSGGINFVQMETVLFKPLSYCFEETVGFDVKSSFASRPLSRLIRWNNKPDDIKEFWEKAVPREFSCVKNYKVRRKYFNQFFFIRCGQKSPRLSTIAWWTQRLLKSCSL